MKAQERHELKTNELAEWLANLPKWAKENLRMIIYITVVVIVVAGLYIWKVYQKDILAKNEKQRLTALVSELARVKYQTVQLQQEGTDYSYMLIELAKRLQNLASNTKNDNIAALALVKKSEALRSELHYRPQEPDRESLENQITQAKLACNQAIERADDNPGLKAMAMFELGLCEEELGNFDAARQIYQQIVEDANFAGCVTKAEAEHRLKLMDNYTKQVVFLTRAKPAQTDQTVSMVPSDIAGPVDINNTVLIDTEDLPEIPTEK